MKPGTTDPGFRTSEGATESGPKRGTLSARVPRRSLWTGVLWTPLSLAARRGYREIVDLLQAAGARKRPRALRGATIATRTASETGTSTASKTREFRNPGSSIDMSERESVYFLGILRVVCLPIFMNKTEKRWSDVFSRFSRV